MTGLWASSSIRRWLSIAAVAAALVGCDSDPVERELVGTWQAAVVSASGAVQLRFTTLSNGQYRIDQTGLAALPAETGYFAAADGEWRKENITGGIEHGTYEFLSDDSVLFQSAASAAVVWTRVADATPAAASAPTASSPLAAAPLEPAPGIAAGAPMPVVADVLSTGPFGPALTPSAPSGVARPSGMPGAPAPFGAPTGTAPAPFGPPQTTTFAAPTAAGAPLFAPPPEIVGAPPAAGMASSLSNVPAQVTQNPFSAGAPAVVKVDAGALADLPQQAVNGFESSARQATADGVDQAAGDAERKVGERLRNFFRRDRQRNEQEAEDP